MGFGVSINNCLVIIKITHYFNYYCTSPKKNPELNMRAMIGERQSTPTNTINPNKGSGTQKLAAKERKGRSKRSGKKAWYLEKCSEK